MFLANRINPGARLKLGEIYLKVTRIYSMLSGETCNQATATGLCRASIAMAPVVSKV